jgi:predicted alpha/beta hydrolase family esterase
MSNPNVIIIHGNGETTIDDCWYPSVARQLGALGLHVIAHTMPMAETAPAHIWLPHIEEELGANENSILVGHSSGAIAAMRYAETHRIHGSVLVGAYCTDLGNFYEKRSGYFGEPWDWDAIKTNQHWIAQFASTDDPYIPIEEPRHVHDRLDTDYFEFTDRGHFQGYDFPELTAVVKEKLEP